MKKTILDEYKEHLKEKGNSATSIAEFFRMEQEKLQKLAQKKNVLPKDIENQAVEFSNYYKNTLSEEQQNKVAQRFRKEGIYLLELAESILMNRNASADAEADYELRKTTDHIINLFEQDQDWEEDDDEMTSLIDIFRDALYEVPDLEEGILVGIGFINHMLKVIIAEDGELNPGLIPDIVDFYASFNDEFADYVPMVNKAWACTKGPLVFRIAKSVLKGNKTPHISFSKIALPNGTEELFEAGVEGIAYDAINAIMDSIDDEDDDEFDFD